MTKRGHGDQRARRDPSRNTAWGHHARESVLQSSIRPGSERMCGPVVRARDETGSNRLCPLPEGLVHDQPARRDRLISCFASPPCEMDPRRLTRAANIVAREFDGQHVPVGEAADPVAVVSRFGDLKPAAPLPAKMTAYLDRGPNRELPRRCAIWKTFHCLLGSAEISGLESCSASRTSGSESDDAPRAPHPRGGRSQATPERGGHRSDRPSATLEPWTLWLSRPTGTSPWLPTFTIDLAKTGETHPRERSPRPQHIARRVGRVASLVFTAGNRLFTPATDARERRRAREAAAARRLRHKVLPHVRRC
jgi:hypothetical protein